MKSVKPAGLRNVWDVSFQTSCLLFFKIYILFKAVMVSEWYEELRKNQKVPGNHFHALPKRCAAEGLHRIAMTSYPAKHRQSSLAPILLPKLSQTPNR